MFGERILAQLISTLVTIVLARLLTPEHYGVISIVTVCISLLNVFVVTGFGSALVQKKEADAVDFDTAFWLSFSMSLVLYGALFFASPAIAAFYETPLLCQVLRVMGLRLPLAAINNIQRSYVQRAMNFKRFFVVTLVATLLSGVVGIGLAIAGLGVWALVAQYMSNTVVSTVFLFAVCLWRPKWQFSVAKAKEIWNFGWKVLLTQLVATLEGDIRSLIVGKVFGSADLAFYDQGKKYPALLMTNISASIDSVMLSAYSKEQEDRQRLLSMLRRSIRTGLYLLAPLLLGFAAVAESFTLLLLTEKWMPAVPFMQIFCLVYLTRPLESSCRQALLSIGKSGAALVAIVLVNVVALLGTMIAVFALENVFMIAVVSLISTCMSLLCFMSFSNYHLGYKLKMQLADTLPTLLVGAVMFAAVRLAGSVQMHILLQLIFQIVVGAGVYVGISVAFRVEPFRYLLGMLKGRMKKKISQE